MSNPEFGILDRAKEAFKVSSYKELAEKLGTATSNVSNWKTRNDMPLEFCKLTSELTGVSLDWLISGKEFTPINNNSSINNYNDAFVSIPLYDITASAGNGCTFDDERIISELSFRQDWIRDAGLHQKDLVCLSIRGDSMEPTLKSGDTILVNRAKKSGDGIFVLRVGEQLRVKRLHWLMDGKIKVISDNPIYEPETINPCEIDGFFEIIGSCHTRIGLVQ